MTLAGILRGLTAPRQKAKAAPAAAVDYKGYAIRPASRRESGQWITAGVIAKRFDEEVKEQHFVRADMFASRDDADACSIAKGKRIIDELGDRLFADGEARSRDRRSE